MQNYKKIFLYNKSDELITYVKTNKNKELIDYYCLENRVLTKINTTSTKIKNKLKIDTIKSKIVFSEDCILNYMAFDEESSRIVAYKKNSNRFENPLVESRMYSVNDNLIKEYTIDNNILQTWLKKL